MRSSAHTNPQWLKNLKLNFKTDIIDKCAINVQEAVKNNSRISQIRECRDIRNAIINTTVNRIVEIFGGVSRPKIKEVREIVVEMQFVYPAMFREDVGSGYGFGGSKGVDGLANQMMDRIRSRDGLGCEKNPIQDTETDGNILPPKKGKKKLIYGMFIVFNIFEDTLIFLGVDNNKWYVQVSDVKQTEAIKAFGRVNDKDDFMCRETVYEEFRDSIAVEFRKSKKPIPNVCRGFNKDFRHLENQFKHLSSTDGLVKVVDANFKQQIGYLEMYLCHVNKTLEFTEFLEEVDLKCQVDFSGSKLFKYIQLFVSTCLRHFIAHISSVTA